MKAFIIFSLISFICLANSEVYLIYLIEPEEEEPDTIPVTTVSDSTIDTVEYNSTDAHPHDDLGFMIDNLDASVDCETVIDKVFSNFETIFAKTYDCEETHAAAKKNVLDHLKFIRDHNARELLGEISYRVGMQKFHDISFEEASIFLSGTKLERSSRSLSVPASYEDGPDSVNFTQHCLPIVDQRYCASCWSFSAVAQVEAMYKRLDPDYSTPLSQQYLVDCSKTNGCSGGWPKNALTYIKDNGIVKNSTYPYDAKNGTCEDKRKMGTVPDIAEVKQYKLDGNETMLKNIVGNIGPVVVAIDASKSFMAYKSGIFSDPDCETSCGKINHGVLVVGYGTDENGKDFWIIRNSYGTDWGEMGYMRMARNNNNTCLVACFAIFSFF